MNILERIGAIGLMPVVADLVEIEDCLLLGRALLDGGIPAVEVTFRMKDAEKAIRLMRDAYPGMLVGAGTVTSVEQAQKALEAGAMFMVSPGLNKDVVAYCQDAQVPIVPGIATASELEQAIHMGLCAVKFFPAEQNGGLAAIKALCGPYKGVSFMPTGGINLDNLAEYLSYERVCCCGGTFMLGKNLAERDFDAITTLCKKSVATMLGLKVAHVGINCADEASAQSAAGDISSLLSLENGKDGNSSVFAGTAVECMKAPYLGANGHIGMKTNHVERAVKYFTAIGKEFDWESAKRDAKGTLKAIYFKEEIGGFAFHLV